MINFYNIDNIEFMKTKPDNYYDLAIVDPPYGGNDAIGLKDNKKQGKQATKRTNYKVFENTAPTAEYFDDDHHLLFYRLQLNGRSSPRINLKWQQFLFLR